MLVVENIVKQYSLPHHAGSGQEQVRNGVDGVSFEVAAGELFTLLGPSGCGKTTTLRSIGGLETPDSGQIRLGEQILFDSAQRVDVPANRRGLAMVFQSYAVWPHMTVFENTAFPLRIVPRRSRLSRDEISDRVEAALQTVGLHGFAGQSATRLSGGQQQRLALARALVTRPPMVLLDEPLSNLDATLRENMRIELKRLQREMGLTAIYVTHDQAEALSMSSRVAIMNGGRLVQVGRPRDLYERPVDQFVASFLGISNFVAGTVVETGREGIVVETAIGRVRAVADHSFGPGAPVLVCLRSEELHISMQRSLTPVANELSGRLEATAFLGDRIDHIVSIGATELRVRSHSSVRIKREADVFLTVSPADVVVLAR